MRNRNKTNLKIKTMSRIWRVKIKYAYKVKIKWTIQFMNKWNLKKKYNIVKRKATENYKKILHAINMNKWN